MSKTTSRGFTFTQLTENPPKKELGDYCAVSGGVLANLKIIVHIQPHLDVSYRPWVNIRYSAQVSFENKGADKLKEQPRAKVTFEYNDQNNLNEVFADLSAHEEDIEGVFEKATIPEPTLGSKELTSKANWKFKRNVMRCILQLEERVESEKIGEKTEDFRKEYDS